MKRNTLTTAVLAGLTGLAGMMSTASAVNVNPDGLGQVLLYPYYSARSGNQTLISVVNTTSNAKAVKIRFLEALNSLEVLDFNIYLSEFDVWVAAIADIDGDGVADLDVPDTTCTSPFLFDPATQNADEGQQRFIPLLVASDPERTLSGHLEIIEMGTLVDEGATPFETWATHGNNPDYDPADPDAAPRFTPNNCAMINRAWSTVSGVDGVWLGDAGVGIDPASGGLFGGGTVMNVGEGTMFSYNATAIDAFYTATGSDHTFPGSLEPSLIGDPTGLQPITNTVSNIFVDGGVVTDDWGNTPNLGTLLALNATITRETVLNEYVYGQGADVRTEWLLTFPTKTFHVNGTTPIAPFTELFGATDCEQVFFEQNLYDREEQTTPPGSDGPVVSPQEPGDDPQEFELCFESQVVRYGPQDEYEALTESEILKEPAARVVNIDPVSQPLGFTSGWTRLSFNPIDVDGEAVVGSEVHESVAATSGAIYQGLPVIGFAVTTFDNGTLEDEAGVNVFSSYAGKQEHRGTRRITQAPVTAGN